MRNPPPKQCFVCGGIFTFRQYEFWNMHTIRDCYMVSEHKEPCPTCGDKAGSFVNYYGKKKQRDLEGLHNFLVSGVLPMRKYQQQINAGYIEINHSETI